MKIALLGDSITEGLGSKKINYMNTLQNVLRGHYDNVEITNFALSGSMIDYPFLIKEQLDTYSPDICVIFYGNVEAIRRPILNKESVVYRIMPSRYKKNISMLDPRPFYSHRKAKKIIQHIDSSFRFLLKRYFMNKYGSEVMMDLDKFSKLYALLIKELIGKRRKLIVISNVRIDDYYFPGSSESLRLYRNEIKKIADAFEVIYIDLYSKQLGYSWNDIYGNDHFHPNVKGYTLIGEMVADSVITIANS